MVTRQNVSITFTSFFLAMLIAACGGGLKSQLSDRKAKVRGDRTLVAHSEGVEPLWIQECPTRAAHTLPFCGESHRRPNQKLACTEAYTDALGKLRRTVDQKVDASLEPDGQGGYRFKIQGAESEPINVRGVWEDQRWYEEYQGPQGGTFDCYVMITYPALEYNNLMGMARKATLDRVVKAAKLHEQGKDLVTEGRHAEAVVLLERALGLLSGLKEQVNTSNGTNSSLLSEQVAADLKAAKLEATQTEKTALVVVHLVLDGKPRHQGALARSVRNQVENWLSDHGMHIRPGGLDPDRVAEVLAGNRTVAAQAAAEKGAGLLLVLEIESEFKAKEDEVYYAFAVGAFRLVRTADGRELHACDLGPEKGALFNRSNAVEKAVENLCKEQLREAVKIALSKI